MPAIPFGRYILHQLLAVGGMGEVHLAEDTGSPGAFAGYRRACVIKRIKPELLQNAEAAGMFAREAACAALLNHANVVQLWDHGAVDGAPYVALEYVHGVNLKALLDAHRAQGQQLPLPEVVHIAHSLALALDYAHRRTAPDGTPLRLIHRDISPQNVLLSTEGEVKLTDFGMAKGALRGHYQTQETSLKGKLAYFSPEQAAGEALDQRTDIFSLGSLLYEMATLKHPFAEGVEGFKLLDRVKRAEVESPQPLRPDLPRAFLQVLAGCLMRDPAERLSTVAEVVGLLEEVRAEVRPAAGVVRLAQHLRQVPLPPLPRFGSAPAATGTTRESVKPISGPITQPALAPAKLPDVVAVAVAPLVAEREVSEIVLKPSRAPWWGLGGVVLGSAVTAVALQAGGPGNTETPLPQGNPPSSESPDSQETLPTTVGPNGLRERQGKPPPRRQPPPRAPVPEPEKPVQPAPPPRVETSVSEAPPPRPPPVTVVVAPPAPVVPLAIPSSPGVPPSAGFRFNAVRKVRVSVDGAAALEALQGRMELTPGSHDLRVDLEGVILTVGIREASGGSRTAFLGAVASGRLIYDGRDISGATNVPIARGGSTLTLATPRDAVVLTLR